MRSVRRRRSGQVRQMLEARVWRIHQGAGQDVGARLLPVLWARQRTHQRPFLRRIWQPRVHWMHQQNLKASKISKSSDQ